MMSSYSLQLFPLQTILYPYCILPLHIFEPRYRKMIAMCIEHDVPFGVVQIQSGSEVGGQASVSEIGTVARIQKVVQLDDGRMLITTFGEQRFRILQSSYDEECMTAVVKAYEDEPVDMEPHQELAAEVRKLFLNYWKLHGLVTNKDLGSIELPEEPEIISWLIPSVLHVQPVVKQGLLESTNCLERMRSIHHLLIAEIEKMLELMREVPGH
jgi:Lon protease-like protein